MAERRARVVWATIAQQDVSDIVAYVAADSIDRARQLAQRVRRTARALETFPDGGRMVPELRAVGVFTFRELIAAPYRLIYRVDSSTAKNVTVTVLAVLDSRRDLRDLLFERLVRTAA